jgi:deazaflavin-dependent oxidoreductase (nitroreductase family)
VKPQDYSARTAYRPPAPWYRRLNRLGVLLTSLGLAPGDAVTLEVRGRTSGRTRRVPVLRTRYRDEDYLVALAGESQWVRNLRASRGRAVIRRRGAHPVHAVELPPAERPQVIAEYLRAGRRRSGTAAGAAQARFYFGLEPDASTDDIGPIADRYPVFRIRYLDRGPGSTEAG